MMCGTSQLSLHQADSAQRQRIIAVAMIIGATINGTAIPDSQALCSIVTVISITGPVFSAICFVTSLVRRHT